MDTTQEKSAERRALERMLRPRSRGSAACGLDDAVVREILADRYTGPCAFRGSPEQATRHLDRPAVTAETAAHDGKPLRGRAAATGHMYVSPERAADREEERDAIATIRAERLISRS